MMRFSHSTNGRSVDSFPIRCTAALLIAVLSGGCSASISRFDGPSFSLNDDKKDQTSSIQTTGDPGNRGPNYLGNEGRYDAPRSNADGRVAVANLPDPPPSSPSYDQRAYDQRGQQALCHSHVEAPERNADQDRDQIRCDRQDDIRRN